MRGLDGKFYPNTQEGNRERIAADARWRQQERQNQLLKKQQLEAEKQNKILQEQNRLIRQQQEEQRWQYQMEQRRIEEEEKQRRLEKERQEKLERFEKGMQEKVFPLMVESGIKNPDAYITKMIELYIRSKPEKELLKTFTEECLNKPIPKNEISKYPAQMQETLNQINILIQPKLAILIKLYTFFTFIGGICSFISSKDFMFSIIFAICLFVLFMIMAIAINKTSIPRSKEEAKKKIKNLNLEIEQYNNKISQEFIPWENKIKNFEKKRLDDFNYKFEFAIDEAVPIMSEIWSDVDFRLHFNQYPADYEEKKKAYFREIRRKQAEEDGIEIFEDLGESIEEDNINIPKTEFDIVLIETGANKISVINIIRDVTGLGLKEANELVKKTPKTIKYSVTEEEAKKLKSKFAEVGATIELK